MNNTSQYKEWESEFNACSTGEDYRRYYIRYVDCNDNPFQEKALKKAELYKSYFDEFLNCNSVEKLEKYVLKYIDTDNPYITEAKTKIAELSKYNTPRWGVYRLLGGILCFLLAIGCLFLVIAVNGTHNSILGLIGILSLGGILVFTYGGIWLIYQGIKVLKSFRA